MQRAASRLEKYVKRARGANIEHGTGITAKRPSAGFALNAGKPRGPDIFGLKKLKSLMISSC